MKIRLKTIIMTLILLCVPEPGHVLEQTVQGTIIPCEECVVLYPDKYKKAPETCPVCRGQKEHFQPARMMDAQLAALEAEELESNLEDYLLETIKQATKKTVSIKTLKEIRKFYIDKLIFHLIYNKFELATIKARIFQLDALISEKPR